MKRKTAKTRSHKPVSRRQCRLPLTRSITFRLDDAVLAKAEAVLTDRGTDIKSWMALQIGALSKVTKPVVGLVDPMPFGKYLGAKVEDVVRGDPSYAKWMLQTEGTADRFNQEVVQLYVELSA